MASDKPPRPRDDEPTGMFSGGGANRDMIVFLGIGMALVFEVGVAAGIGFWLGHLMDQKLGSAPLGILLGLILFLGTSITHAVFALKQAQKRFESSDRD